MNTEVDFDKQEHLEKIQPHLIPGEALYAVYHVLGSNQIVGFTDARLISCGPSFLGRKAKTIAVPYSQVTSIGFEAGDWKSSARLTIATSGGQKISFSFRGDERTNGVYRMILAHTLGRATLERDT